MNQTNLVGRLTKDPILKYFAENRAQVNFTLAVDRNYRNYKGEVDADFLFCTAWEKLAEHIAKYCGKGSLIGINGRLQSRSYVKDDKTKIYMTEVVVENVRFYVLKPKVRGSGGNSAIMLADSGAQQVAEPPILNGEFVLPQQQPSLT